MILAFLNNKNFPYQNTEPGGVKMGIFSQEVSSNITRSQNMGKEDEIKGQG